MNLYPQNTTPTLQQDIFRHPPAEYRGAPFWSWNNKLNQAQLLQQIAYFKQMGMGGFHIHVRTGLMTEYLGDEFMHLVRLCVEKAHQQDLLVWLYDEDRWPSGAAGGIVTQEPQFRAQHLLFTRTPYERFTGHATAKQNSTARASRTGNGVLLARYHVTLHQGRLAGYRRLEEHEVPPTDAHVWFAYLETATESPWFNNQTYVDTLNKAAITRFLNVTYERYYEAVGDYFGTTIPAIFTDEPQFAHKASFALADDAYDLVLPWTTDLLETYWHTYGQRLEDTLPELFWELPNGAASVVRYHYHDHICERFTQAFADTIGSWCQDHNLALTGHMMNEPTLLSQTQALGEAMRCYRSFAIPGIDMLCDWREYTTAKQAQSVAHQYGRPGVASELYGVTNWDFDFVGHKGQGDWQAALGVTVRVHHLSWVSMAGEAKRDYPASISYQSPWYQEYPLVENHFARLNTALTRGRALVRVCVIHPIESFWLSFGPLEHTAVEREEQEQHFIDLTRWLLFGLIDFDFVCEALLPSLCPQQAGSQLLVGEAQYDAVIVPALRTMRTTTLERLEQFHEAGGTIIFAGEIPSLVDAAPSERGKSLAATCQYVALTRGRLLEALAPFREVSIRLADGRPSDSLLHQMRIDGDRCFLFFCNTDREQERAQTTISVQGEWKVTVLETLTGEMTPLTSQLEDGATVIHWSFPPHSSLLLLLEPGWSSRGTPQMIQAWSEDDDCHNAVPVTLSEPNVLLLDMAMYRLDNEQWHPTEEVLRIDNILRQRLGFPLKMEAFAQPWVDREPQTSTHRVSLKFEVSSDIDVDAPLLALEDATQIAIFVDKQPVQKHIRGWFVDEALQTVPLPDLKAGVHEILLEMPYDKHTNLEWCYLLGDFGVEVSGRHTHISAPVHTLTFGDWTRQGLPFYAGNVTYHCTIEGRGKEMAVKTPKFKAPLLSVSLDGHERGKIAFAPFQLELGTLAVGKHTLDITTYGNRVNAFGCVHNADDHTVWFGPEAWRTQGDAWTYEYQLKPMGLLVAPKMLIHPMSQ